MANKLKGLSVTSVDLVDQGANPDAHIRLFKRGDQKPTADPDDGIIRKFLAWLRNGQAERPDGSAVENPTEGIAKDAQTFADNISREQLREVTGQMYDCCYALSDSLGSIICDTELDAEAKQGMILTSLNEFSAAIHGAAASWASGQKAQGSEGVQKTAAQQQAFEEMFVKYEKSSGEQAAPEGQPKPKTEELEDSDTMKIDKSKMTPEEQATLAEFEKRYGVPDDAPGGEASAAELPAPEGGVGKSVEPPASFIPQAQPAPAGALHPDVEKALAEFRELAKRRDTEVEELKKSLEIERLTAVAKKYEVLGKKADELAAKLYDLKKAGGTVYDDYVALLDENVNAITKSGLFGEIGSNRSGSVGTEQTLGIKAAELAKSATGGLTTPEAIIKAWEENPELAAQYEAEYMKG